MLLDGEKLRIKMGKAARRRFEKNFTVGKMVELYEAMYDGVA